MRDKAIIKKMIFAMSFIVVIAVLFGYIAYNNKTLAEIRNNEQNTSNDIQPDSSTPIYSGEIKQNLQLTDMLEEEEIVELGKVYTCDNIAYASMILKDDVNKQDAEKVANDYMVILKKEYAEMKVNVQAVRGGENIVNLYFGF